MLRQPCFRWSGVLRALCQDLPGFEERLADGESLDRVNAQLNAYDRT